MIVPPTVLVLHIERITVGLPASVLACSRCGQDRWLRLIACGSHLVVAACDEWHAFLHADMTRDELERHAGPDVPRWELANGEVPDDLEQQHPGITKLLTHFGLAVPYRGGQLPDRRHWPARPREWREADQLRHAFFNDQTQGHPDDILLVPLSRRELDLLRLYSYRPDPVSPGQRVLRALGDDIGRRAAHLLAADPEHIRQLVRDDAEAARTVQWYCSWILLARRATAAEEAEDQDGDESS
ncbi:hypothetical protein GCM10025787_03200 [Saccharopolyspora rosea]|uniref:Uncharacterized protein n=1 Tax=Saccharopolyspora rosea TaxID=524884 RepID=A0ABW3FMZ4_9PSEU